MAEVLGTWEGLERQVGAIRRKLLDQPGLEPEVLAQVRARLEGVLSSWLRTAVYELSGPVWGLICMLCWRRSTGVLALDQARAIGNLD